MRLEACICKYSCDIIHTVKTTSSRMLTLSRDDFSLAWLLVPQVSDQTWISLSGAPCWYDSLKVFVCSFPAFRSL